jgi:hypothetical protein
LQNTIVFKYSIWPVEPNQNVELGVDMRDQSAGKAIDRRPAERTLNDCPLILGSVRCRRHEDVSHHPKIGRLDQP